MRYFKKLLLPILALAATMFTSTGALAWGPQILTAATSWNCYGASYTSTDPNIPALTIKTNENVVLNGCKFNNAVGTVILIETTGSFTCTNCVITGGVGSGGIKGASGDMMGKGAAILVKTPPGAPSSAVARVTLDTSRITGKGVMININNYDGQASKGNVALTVNNSRIYGENPNVLKQAQGRFIVGSKPVALKITNNDVTNTAGIKINGLGYAMPEQLLISRNTVYNVNGRLSTGNNGYLTTEPTDTTPNGEPIRRDLVQFVQLSYVKSAFNQSMEISWNQIINQPGSSGVEDNINIYQTQGTPALPLRIANNFIRGAYPIDMNSASYSGGGIITDGWVNLYGIHSPAYVTIESNQVVDTVNYGISIAAGHHNIMSKNTVVGVNRLPSGNISRASNLGMAIWRGAKFGGPVLTADQIAANADIEANFHDNSAKDNKVGWTRYDGTVDANGNLVNPNGINATYWFQVCDPAVTGCSPITDVSNNIDLGLPALTAGNAEFTVWQNKLTSAGVVIGPNWQ
ncbi:MAG: hypothetical protein EOP38_15675 [Rubrivivax sp.]|nr:MAG: hypothetical protein EOP38_15675 [Rubrivivax sp.]